MNDPSTVGRRRNAARLRVFTLFFLFLLGSVALGQSVRLKDALGPNSTVSPGQWMTLKTKDAAGATIYGFIVRGRAGKGARWATMALSFTNGRWKTASVATDRQVALEHGKGKALLIADNARPLTEQFESTDGQTLNFDAGSFSRLLMRTGDLEVGFLPATKDFAVGVNFDVSGFRQVVASAGLKID